MEDGDWLENAVSVPASENGDDLELVIEPSLGSQPDHNEVTQNFQRDDELFPTVANGGRRRRGQRQRSQGHAPRAPFGQAQQQDRPPAAPRRAKAGRQQQGTGVGGLGGLGWWVGGGRGCWYSPGPLAL